MTSTSSRRARSATRPTRSSSCDARRRRPASRSRSCSERDEAYYGYVAAINTSTLTDGVVLEIGGGSMQLVHVADRHALEMESFPLGAVRLTEHFLTGSGPAKKKDLQRLRAHVRDTLEPHLVAARLRHADPAARRRRRRGAQPRGRRPARRRAARHRRAGLRHHARRRCASSCRRSRRCRSPSAAISRASSPGAATSSSPPRSRSRR